LNFAISLETSREPHCWFSRGKTFLIPFRQFISFFSLFFLLIMSFYEREQRWMGRSVHSVSLEARHRVFIPMSMLLVSDKKASPGESCEMVHSLFAGSKELLQRHRLFGGKPGEVGSEIV
jgi:hypothetical protein